MLASFRNWWLKPARGSRVALFAFFYPLFAITVIQFFINVIELKTGLGPLGNIVLVIVLVYLPPLASFWRLDLNPLPKILNVLIIALFYLPAMLYGGLFYHLYTSFIIYGHRFYV